MATNGYQHIEVRPIAGACGAEIHGVDLNALSDAAFAEIRAAWHDHLVIFFRDQSLDDEQLKAFGRRFAPLFRHPNFVPQDDQPDIVRIYASPTDTRIVGEDWHQDTSCMVEPPSGAVLYAVEVPPAGGDTLFANQYLAYETLSDGLKAALAERTSLHSDIRVAGPQARARITGRSSVTRADDAWRPTEATHPVFRTHPETGRKALFVNRSYTQHFDGMTNEESQPLLDFLERHATRPELTCRFRWEKGSVAVWDNRCVMHIAMHDYKGHWRKMHRVQMTGDRPV
ncbi:MAG: TauD/TfdA family dioxygenase [Alphaproteobacteria bacterium]|nr:TauD/TfdA family dioxygenase [Alphaproteobacteria bacterium]MCB9929928.1 TauD/TfdA family dioxygenase [Alphaproteobacteria bacterium]